MTRLWYVLPVAAIAIGFVIWRLTRPWDPAIESLPAFEENSDVASLSPDGTTLLYPSDRGQRTWGAYTMPLHGNEPRLVSPEGMSCTSARWTRDGKAVVLACLVAGASRIVRQPLAGGPHTDLGPGTIADDCGDGVLAVDGSRLVLYAAGERVLFETEDIDEAKCDLAGRQVVFNFPDQIAVLDRATGRARRLGPGESGSFTPHGKSVVFSRLDPDGKRRLYEFTLEDGSLHPLTPSEEHAHSPTVTNDGTRVVFARDITSYALVVHDGRTSVQKAKLGELSHLAPTAGAVVAQSGTMLVVIELATGSPRTLVAGELPVVRRDGRTVLFRDSTDGRQLKSVPLAGGDVTLVALLPGTIREIGDAADGIHVSTGQTQAAYRIADGKAVAEGAYGLVMPSGGWRAVKLAEETLDRLHFLPPGSDTPAFTRDAVRGRPRWLDDRRFAYCDPTSCRVLDVETGTETSIPFDSKGQPIAMAPDGTRWFTAPSIGRVTRHLITNFADRPWRP